MEKTVTCIMHALEVKLRTNSEYDAVGRINCKDQLTIQRIEEK